MFGLVYLTAGVLLPGIGYVLDKYGQLALAMCFASLSCLAANLMWVMLPETAS
jgi:hypothetical protein